MKNIMEILKQKNIPTHAQRFILPPLILFDVFATYGKIVVSTNTHTGYFDHFVMKMAL